MAFAIGGLVLVLAISGNASVSCRPSLLRRTFAGMDGSDRVLCSLRYLGRVAYSPPELHHNSQGLETCSMSSSLS